MPDGSSLVLGSDACTNSWSRWIRPITLARAKEALSPEQRTRYLNWPYTIGQSIIWPLRTKDGSINRARAQGEVADRPDLTLECVRRHYGGEASPLAAVLSAYSDYFSLFDDFEGFVRFFFLDDLVSSDYGTVRIPTAFDDFTRNAAPASLDEYVTLREAALEFGERRERRMAAWASAQSDGGPAADSRPSPFVLALGVPSPDMSAGDCDRMRARLKWQDELVARPLDLARLSATHLDDVAADRGPGSAEPSTCRDLRATNLHLRPRHPTGVGDEWDRRRAEKELVASFRVVYGVGDDGLVIDAGAVTA